MRSNAMTDTDLSASELSELEDLLRRRGPMMLLRAFAEHCHTIAQQYPNHPNLAARWNALGRAVAAAASNADGL